MNRYVLLTAPAAMLLLGGCLAKAAVNLATAPVRAASQAADWATTSQDEADRNRGREIRHREERVDRLQREYASCAESCADGDDRACRAAVEIRREIDRLLPSIPAEPIDG